MISLNQMTNNISEQIARNLCKENYKIDQNGILHSEYLRDPETLHSKNVWEKIYNFDMDAFKKDRDDFFRSKLEDHINHIRKSYVFNPSSICLEIGSGPAYIGEYIMKEFDSFYAGIDFNYEMLLTVKKYFDQKGFKKYLLIYGDIKNMPVKDNVIDFIYSGGVIEHFPNTGLVLRELYRVLKAGGVSFNSVPCFNFSWIFLRSFANIPSTGAATNGGPSAPIFLKKVFEYIHIGLLKNKILDKFYGYELSFTRNSLRKLHERNGFKDITIGPFACHPSIRKLRNPILRKLYFNVQKSGLTSFFHYVFAKK